MRAVAACLVVLGGCGSGSRPERAAQADVPDIEVYNNCQVLGPKLLGRCLEFVHNNLHYVVPALEDISGAKLETCYPTVHFRFTEQSDHGPGGQAKPDGTIVYAADMARDWFTSDPPFLYDPHELLHLLYNCVRVPARANHEHTFWDPVEIELDRAVLKRSALAAATKQLAIDRSELAAGHELAGGEGCFEVETYLLDGEYVRQPERPLVHEFFERLIHDPVLAGAGLYDHDPKYERAYLQIVSDLVAHAPNRELLARTCEPPSRSR
jgi:hypothetical protein